MDWETVLAEVITILSKAIIVAAVTYLVKLAKEKVHNDKINKYIDNAGDIVCQCVDYVSQTYVDALKKDGKFDKQAQAEAYEMCKERVLYTLNENAKQAIIEMFGDFDYWLESAIECSVRNSISHIPITDISEGMVIEDV